jgi:uncharacterized protein (UPF0297 family)
VNNLENTVYNLDITRLTPQQKEDIIEKGLKDVHQALCEKGYNPLSQMAGYILTEDPTYITSHNNARAIMSKMDKYDILEILLKNYFENMKL